MRIRKHNSKAPKQCNDEENGNHKCRKTKEMLLLQFRRFRLA
jgi:hypothetical protein